MKHDDGKKIEKLREKISLISKTSEFLISEPYGVNKPEKEKNIFNFNPNYMGSCKSKSINMTEFCNDIENVKFDNISTYIHDETDNISNFNKKVSNNKCIDSNYNNYLKTLKSNNKDEEEFDLNCIEKGNDHCKLKDIGEIRTVVNNKDNSRTNLKIESKFSISKIENDKRKYLNIPCMNSLNNNEVLIKRKSEYSQVESCKSSCNKIIRSTFCKLSGDMYNFFKNRLKKFAKEMGDSKAIMILKFLKHCKITKETLYSKHNFVSILFFLNTNFMEFLSNVIVNLITNKPENLTNDEFLKKNEGLNLLLMLILENSNKFDFNCKHLTNTNNPSSDIDLLEFKKEIENQINLQAYNKKLCYLNEEGLNYLELMKDKCSKNISSNCNDLKLLELVNFTNIQSVSESTNIDSKSIEDLDILKCRESKSTFENCNFDFKWDSNVYEQEQNLDLRSRYSYQMNQNIYSALDPND